MTQNKILSSVSSQVIVILVSTLIGLALVPITINMLGKIEYGAFELILSLIIIDTFLEFGIGSALVKYIPEFKYDTNRLHTFLWSYYYIKFFLTLIGFLIVGIVGYNFETIFNVSGINNLEDIKIATYIFGVGLFISSTTTFFDNLLKGLVYFGSSNLIKVISMVLFFMLFYSYYVLSDNYNIVEIAFIWFVCKPVLLFIIQIILLKYLKILAIFTPKRFDFDMIKSTLHFMFGMTYITMVAQLYNRMPKILLGIFTGPIAVAYWGIMEKIREPLLSLENSMIRPLIPILSDKQNIVNMTEQKTLQAVRIQYFFMSFLGIMTIVHVDLFIYLWLGNEYTQVSSLVKIALLTFLFPKANILLMMYYAKGETRINRIFITINATISLLLGTVVLYLTNDIELFALTIICVSLIMTSFNIIKYTNYFGFNKLNFFKDSVVQPFGVVIVFYVVHVYFVSFISENLIGLFLSLFCSFVIYSVLFMLLMKNEDKALLKRFTRKLK